MAAKKGPPFDCPKLPSSELQNLITECSTIATNSFWLKYYLPNTKRIDSGIGVRLSSALSIQNAPDHHNSESSKDEKPKHKRKESSFASRKLESLQFELCLASHLGSKPKAQSGDNSSNGNNNNDGANNNGGGADYDDPFAGLSFDGGNDNSKKEEKKNNDDPFMGPFEKGSHICDLSKDYRLILNKYPFWPNNLLVISKDFVEQSKSLNEIEFDFGYKVLQSAIMAVSTSDCPHLLFLNSGDNSGASMKHRHFHLIYNLSHLPLNIIAAYLNDLKMESEMAKQRMQEASGIDANDASKVDANVMNATLDAMADDNESKNNESKTDESKDNDNDAATMVSPIANVMKNFSDDFQNESIKYKETKDGITTFSGFDFVHGIMLLDSKKWADNKYEGKEFKSMYDSLINYVKDECSKKDKNFKSVDSYNLLLNSQIMMVVPRKAAQYKDFTVNALPFAGLFFATNDNEMGMISKANCHDILKGVTY